MDDVVIRARTLDHAITFLIVIGIVVIANIFIIKYTGWFCDCPSTCEENKTTKSQVIVDEEPIIIEEEVDEVIIIPDAPLKVEPNKIEEKPKEKIEPETQNSQEDEKTQSKLLSGEMKVSIDDIDYENKNTQFNDSDFVSMKSITITIDNNDINFVPLLRIYLYDTQHRANKNQYPEPDIYLEQIRKGEIKTWDVELKALSLENVNAEKIIAVEVFNGAEETFLEREEKTFTP